MTTETEQFFDRAGGSAFPIVVEGGDQSGLHAELHPGMTLRDYFAGQALAGLSALLNGKDANEAARRAYQAADEMLKARIS